MGLPCPTRLFASLGVISLLFCTYGQAQYVDASQCASSVHAIIARGSGTGDVLNVLVALQDLILAEIPGSTSLGLPYNYSKDNVYEAVQDGAWLVQNYIEEYVASCGADAKIAVIGYSLVRLFTAI